MESLLSNRHFFTLALLSDIIACEGSFSDRLLNEQEICSLARSVLDARSSLSERRLHVPQRCPQHLVRELVEHHGVLKTGPINDMGILRLALDLSVALKKLELRMTPVPRSKRTSMPRTDLYCIVCRKDIHSKAEYRRVHCIEGGHLILHPEDESKYVSDGGDLGMQPIGSDCLRKIGMEWTWPK